MNLYKRGFYWSPDFMGESSWNGYERNPLFVNFGEGRFQDMSRAAGSDCVKDSRGVAVADLNRDGLQDLVVSNNNAEPVVYLNRWAGAGNWLRLDLEGTASNRDAVGAVARLTITDESGERTLTRHVEAGSSYASQREYTLHFGLGEATPKQLEIEWPSGAVEKVDGALDINQTLRVIEKRKG